MAYSKITEEFEKGISILNYSGIKDKILISKHTNIFSMSKKDGYFYIEYSEKVQLFRALTIIKHHLKTDTPFDEISQKPIFNTCGIMIDCSRNAVPTVDSLKTIINYLAKMGLNMIMLYTEDTYKIEKYPYFGYMRGAYTKDEIKEIVEYADIFGIEVIPCIQTLAHLTRVLQWDFANDIKDTQSILLIDEPKSYELIEEMIKTCRECFKTNRIHIGMDEAYETGLGKHLQKHGYEKRFDLFIRHLNKVASIAYKYDFKPMIWSDMVFEENISNDISEYLDKPVNMVYFNYGLLNKDDYVDQIKLHTSKGVLPLFAGGIHTWNSLSANYDTAFATTVPALNACKQEGITDVFATIWGDDGAECSVFSALLGMQLYAEFKYTGTYDKENLEKMFYASTGYDTDSFISLTLDNFDEKFTPNHSAGVSKDIFYQDILQGLVDKNLRLFDFKTYYKNRIDAFEKLNTEGDFKYLFDYTYLIFKVLYRKCDIGIKITDYYLSGDNESLKDMIPELDKLHSELSAVHTKAADIWYKNNKPFGFEVFEFRLAGMEARINRAKFRIDDYLNVKIDSIPELLEERLYYSNIETAFPRGSKGWTSTEVLTPAAIKGA